MITQERIKELFRYKDGKLIRLVSLGRAIKGMIAGTINNISGYVITQIDGKKYLNHRIIFLYHNGWLPECLDHINGIKTDNRIENLRECTPNQNQWNQKKREGTSKYKGVCWDPKNNKWLARVKVNYKYIYLGRFKEEDKAGEVVRKARKNLHGEFCNHG